MIPEAEAALERMLATTAPDAITGELVREIAQLRADLAGLRARCLIAYFPPPTTYPIEHNMAANKDSWDAILIELRAARAKESGS